MFRVCCYRGVGLLDSGGVGGSFLLFLMVSLGGFPAWGHFRNLGLGTGCFDLADAW